MSIPVTHAEHAPNAMRPPLTTAMRDPGPPDPLAQPEIDALAEIAAVLERHGYELPAFPFLGRFDATAPFAEVLSGRRVAPVFFTTSYAIVAAPAKEFVPGESACARCIAIRWQRLRSRQERDALERDGRMQSTGLSPFLASGSLRALIESLVDAATDPEREEPPAGSLPLVTVVDYESGLLRRYPVVPEPTCSCTSIPVDAVESALVKWQRQDKPSPGVYRTRRLEEYPITFEAYANPVCGVLGESLIPDTGSPTTAPVTGYMFVRGSWLLHEFFWSGHGDDYERSGRLAVLEGLERYAGLKGSRVRPTIRAARRDLPAASVDPRTCGLYTDDFYEREPMFVTYSDDLEMNWVWGYSVSRDEPTLVPERLVYYLDADASSNFVQECSNGCATGGSLEEAVLFGLLELIERDAFLAGWYGGAPLREIDPATVPGDDIQFMLARMRLIGYDVRLFDNRMDLEVPVVTAVAVNRDPEANGQICLAAGASLDPADAVRAALCEIASYAPTFVERVTGQLEAVTAMARDYSLVTDLPHHPLLFGLPEMLPEIDFLLGDERAEPFAEVYASWEARRPRTHDLVDDLRFCIEAVERVGHEVVVVEQTSPEQQMIGVHTACVVVPGLLPIDFGWGKQRAPHLPRLKQALVRAGYADETWDHADAHLVPHPFP